jgi:hypothetical protein
VDDRSCTEALSSFLGKPPAFRGLPSAPDDGAEERGETLQPGTDSLTMHTYDYCGEFCVKTLQDCRGRDGNA